MALVGGLGMSGLLTLNVVRAFGVGERHDEVLDQQPVQGVSNDLLRRRAGILRGGFACADRLELSCNILRSGCDGGALIEGEVVRRFGFGRGTEAG